MAQGRRPAFIKEVAMVKNYRIKVCLNAGSKVPECEDGRVHFWSMLEQPEGHSSGYHRKECVYCGVEVSYDTSD